MDKEQFILDRNIGKLDQIWERYFDETHPKHQQVVNRFNWIMDRVHGPKVIDIGCSNGLGVFLSSKINSVEEIYGIDICEKIIEMAKINNCNSNKKIIIKIGMAEELGFENSFFDCIIMGETLEHVFNDKDAISEAYRVLKNKGTIIVTVPEGGKISKNHLRVYSEQLIVDLLTTTKFKIIEINKMLSGHNGSPYWILIKAIKNELFIS
jgi:ubiquinone/menaquinone biosynthesis C-methylase UbiE